MNQYTNLTPACAVPKFFLCFFAFALPFTENLQQVIVMENVLQRVPNILLKFGNFNFQAQGLREFLQEMSMSGLHL